jgi:hypothetical protein
MKAANQSVAEHSVSQTNRGPLLKWNTRRNFKQIGSKLDNGGTGVKMSEHRIMLGFKFHRKVNRRKSGEKINKTPSRKGYHSPSSTTM